MNLKQNKQEKQIEQNSFETWINANETRINKLWEDHLAYMQDSREHVAYMRSSDDCYIEFAYEVYADEVLGE